MEHPNLSIIIVNYNVKQLVLDCLTSIYSTTPESIAVEVILVDNNSSDDSTAAIAHKFPQVKIISNKTNVGFPAANNQGFKIASGNYIFMLNPDTEILEGAILQLFSYMEDNPKINLIAPMLLNTDKSRQISVWRFPTIWHLFCETHYLNFLLGKKNYADKNPELPFEPDSFSGAAILFRKKVIDQIGMLDEKLFWIEDIDFCYRAKQQGLRLLYYPEAKVLHHIGQSAKKNYNVSISNQIFNKIKFFKKHHSKIQWMLTVMLSLYHVLLKLAVFGLLAPFNKTYYRKAKAYLYTLPRIINPPIGMK